MPPRSISLTDQAILFKSIDFLYTFRVDEVGAIITVTNATVKLCYNTNNTRLAFPGVIMLVDAYGLTATTSTSATTSNEITTTMLSTTEINCAFTNIYNIFLAFFSFFGFIFLKIF